LNIRHIAEGQPDQHSCDFGSGLWVQPVEPRLVRARPCRSRYSRTSITRW
jgi:hypothetical protein